MSVQREPFLINELYHVFNRAIDNRKVFDDRLVALSFLKALRYYRSTVATRSLSKIRELDPVLIAEIWREVSWRKYFRVDILAYCLMPTHFHFLLRQKVEDGISKFISDVVNSFTKNFNPLNERKGPLFLPRFKSVRVTTETHLAHVSRYVHLNPYSGGVVDNISQLVGYPWSSFPYYLHVGEGDNLVETATLLGIFGDREKYKDFVTSNADYQRTLEEVKYVDKW